MYLTTIGEIPMPLIKLNSSLEYHLVSFDEDGIERFEPDGQRQSETIARLLRDPTAAYTHVLLMSHGWKGDLPAARAQYDAWVGIAAAARPDAGAPDRSVRPFKPLVIGLHWPSLPWGDETNAPQVQPVLGPNDTEADAWARRLGVTTPAGRAALGSILTATTRNIATASLPTDLRAAYMTLATEVGLGVGTGDSAPGHDHPPFDPNAILKDARTLGLLPDGEVSGSLLLGGPAWSPKAVRDALLMPLRQLSFWKMKDRARQFGERGARELLTTIRAANSQVDIHLMGHSFGCIVVSAAVAGAPDDASPRIPVGSLFLVQGAMSLWSYADEIPSRSGSGYFRRIVAEKLVRGPIITTRSTRDTAVGKIYPLGAWAARQYVLGHDDLPLYGGVGAFGLQAVTAIDLPMGSADHAYSFKSGALYNLEASKVIRNGGGLSGAHSDIVHPEVAHVLWEAIRATPGAFEATPGTLEAAPATAPPRKKKPRGGLLGLSRTKRTASDEHPGPVQGHSFPGDQAAETRGGPESAPPRPTGSEAFQPTPADDTPPRWINAELDGRRADEPLVVSRWYTLKLAVDIAAKVQPGVVSTPLAALNFAVGQDNVGLVVQVDSADFETAPTTRTLILPRRGPSIEPVRFGISPLHDGPCVIKVTLHLDGNFLQQLTLTFQVGKEAQPELEIKTAGRPLSSVEHIRARDIGVSLTPFGGGFDCIAWGSVSGRATLVFNQTFLANAVDQFREELTKVVTFADASGDPVFQTGIDIPADAKDFALKTLARAGALLFNNMFYGPDAGLDSHAIGDFLARKLRADGQPLTLQVVTRGTPIPWACLYIGDASSGATLSWDNFVGMKHIVEQIPMQPGLIDANCDMPSDQPKLSISLNVNAGIDAAMNLPLVGDQMAYWKAAAAKRRISVRSRSTVAELVAALKDSEASEQVIYFYCHAQAVRPDQPGGLDAASLTLDSSITLGNLKLEAPTKRVLSSGPLVFINACESADLSPAFYDGFVPYFMSKGARGVIGTESVTPALFAQHFASAFFDAFLEGQSVGDTFLTLRRRFLQDHGNPLGLLYAVHCDGDVRVLPAPV
jgi:hypothetical protein